MIKFIVCISKEPRTRNLLLRMATRVWWRPRGEHPFSRAIFDQAPKKSAIAKRSDRGSREKCAADWPATRMRFGTCIFEVISAVNEGSYISSIIDGLYSGSIALRRPQLKETTYDPIPRVRHIKRGKPISTADEQRSTDQEPKYQTRYGVASRAESIDGLSLPFFMNHLLIRIWDSINFLK